MSGASGVDERFNSSGLTPLLSWEPATPRFEVGGGRLAVWPSAGTDLWLKTHYGFEVVNTPRLTCVAPKSDWTMSTHVRFEPRHQYDQAGLIVWVSPTCWLKTSVEYEPREASRLGAVVTNGGYSDWSTQEFPAGRNEIHLRVRRTVKGDYTVEHSADGVQWTQLRVAHLMEDDNAREVRAGVYACSPKDEGFKAEFSYLRLTPDER